MKERPAFQLGGLAAHWLSGGLYVEAEGEGWVIDAPASAAAGLAAIGALPRVRGVVLTGGRVQSVGGLPALLCALEPHRPADTPLPIWSPMGDERGALLAEAWSRGWPDRFPLQIDTEAAGAVLELPPFRVHTFAVTRGEPRWKPSPSVFPESAAALRIEYGGLAVAVVFGAAPGTVVRHACRGAALAIVEVGVLPWPATDQPWRMTTEQAALAAADAAVVWMVGDDGRFALPAGRDAH